jgi:cellulose 1,4-beta-cellobiosidase
MAGDGQVSLTWASAANAASYNVKRSTTNGGPYNIITNISSTSFSDTTVTNGTTYYYVVSAVNSCGESSNSSQVSAVPAGASVPAAPGNLVASAISATEIRLTWTSNSNNETGFKLERCAGTSCTNFVQFSTTPAGATSYSNTGLTSNTSYRYRVRAYNSLGNSAYSNISSAKTRPH